MSQITLSNAHLCDKMYIFVFKKKIKRIINTKFRILRKPENDWSKVTTEKSKSICNVLILKLGSGSLELILFFLLCSSAYLRVTYKPVYISNNQQIRKSEMQPTKMNCVESQTASQ